MKFDVLTLLPGFFDSPLRQSIIGRAIASSLISVETHNIRDFAEDRHRTVDDAPYGGGAGMVMKPGPTVAAIEAARRRSEGAKVVLLTPQGRRFTQETAVELSGQDGLIIVCGRYEGVDERVRPFVDMELSIGDYVITGGEAAALVLIEAIGRLVPGVIKNDSIATESFSDGLLEYPQYTRPEEFRGMRVPDVLLSGNHAEIEAWRKKTRVERTTDRRPELDGLKETLGKGRKF
jgi:tRNA (guanine37-N1)-methyltransferase